MSEGSRLLSKAGLVVGLGFVAAVGLFVVVALVVIGLVVGAVVLPGGPSTPDAQFDFQPRGDEVVVTHAGGTSLGGKRVWVEVSGESLGTWHDFGGEDRIDEGDSISVAPVDSGDTVQLFWTPPDGTDERELASFTVP